jgi:hypothetical protein
MRSERYLLPLTDRKQVAPQLPLSAFACGNPEFGSSGLPDNAVSPKLAGSGSAHRRVDAGDELGV